MNAPTIGQRVLTKYGPGTVAGFERITHVRHPVEHPDSFAPGDRIAVRLDNPTAWPCHSANSGMPYFAERDLEVLT